MTGIVEGRIVIVTGAARGIGRGYALEFARQGAKVVVNDLGAEVDGTGSSTGPAGEVVEQIRAAGGEAIANGADVADFEETKRLVESTVEHFGDLHVLVNNAGILRDRMLFNMTEQEWDAVIRVHLKGTFSPLRHAAAYWRTKAKAGEEIDARVINTTSSSGIYGNPGQGNYGAAKAGIAGLTVIAAREMERYGIAVNAIAPAALTRMTDGLGRQVRAPEGEFDISNPENIAPLAVWLASAAAKGITGRVFNVRGGAISVAEGWIAGPGVDKGERWNPAELDEVVPALVAKARENALTNGKLPADQ
ncbi:SDR family oxidoreductase [Saccharopolyspora sp. K220]|uniref:SDR family oxidoreductase n=1 Tax=Saccharopolyspora soli TaxID=2926618 RepID=UPI001F579403|nr:SDR family oxidoreductase [Saccharopolyspora soli]MCI2418824.1 SDR family oxidoreductase [Saccharopolyspora soli]